ncbi:MAG: peptidoglycan editing factor PgeF [Holosporales bacterium]
MMIPFKASSLFQDVPGIAHGFFTRQGGVSQGLCSSLNVTFKDMDSVENVDENRARVGQALGLKDAPFFVRQVHGTNVHLILSQPDRTSVIEADAIISTVPGLAIAVQTADCVPILLVDPNERVIAAIHAGWRGAAAGVIQSTLSAMAALGATPDGLLAAVGPAIGQPHFEVGSEVRETFVNADTAAKPFFTESSKTHHWLLDLKGYTAHVLAHHGVRHLEVLSYNTYADQDLFFSFRRATHRGEAGCGGQASCIALL